MRRSLFITSISLVILLLATTLYVVNLVRDGSQISMGSPIPVYDHSTIALMVVDLQEGTTGQASPTPHYRELAATLIQKVNSLVTLADSLRLPVLYVRQETSHWLLNALSGDQLAHGHWSAELDRRLKIGSGAVFPKETMDAFRNPAVDEFLRSHHADRLIIVGLDVAYCINRTAYAALNRKYRVYVVEDAVISESDSLKLEHLLAFKSASISVIRSDSCTSVMRVH